MPLFNRTAIAFTISFLLFSPGFCSKTDEEGKIQKIYVQPAQATIFSATSMPDRDWWEALWPDPENVIKALGVNEGITAIDLCCGDGYFTLPLAQISSKVYGIELVYDLLEIARKGSEAKKLTNCHWIQGDVMKLTEIVPETVDFVLLANTLHGIPDKEAIGKSIHSILKSEGELAIINWHPKPREETTVLGLPRGPKSELRMSSEEVEKIQSSLGFTLKFFIEFPPYHYGVIFKKAA